MESSDRLLFYGLLGGMFVSFLWESYLNWRQKRLQEKTKNIPGELIGIIPLETFEKARVYAIDKGNFGMVRETISFILNTAFVMCNGFYIMWDFSGKCIKYFGYEPNEKNEMLQSATDMFLLSFISTIVTLPFSVYHTFVLEEKHGFNKQTVSFFIKDKIKSFIIEQEMMLPICCGVIYIVKVGGDYFFLYLWLFILGVTFFIYAIYFDFIAPLFDKYVPLPEGELRTEIENFAKTVEFPLSSLYVVVGSKRSAHSNAYLYGFYKKKRIVLFDTLLKDFKLEDDGKAEGENKKNEDKKEDEKEKKGCDTPEVLAVLGHEIGHWKLSHNIKNFIIGELNLLVVFMLFSKLFNYAPLYRAFGFHNSKPVLIGFIVILHYVFGIYFTVTHYLMTILNRRFEFQADKFAKSLGRGHYLQKSLIKLNSDNLEFPVYDKWYSTLHNSHPSLLERLQALDKEE